MSKYLLFIAAFVAVLSVSAAQAQDSAAPSADASGYGGAVGKSASGSNAKATGTQQIACVGPVSFCDIYRGGQ
ncbi:hypothetical protein AWB68_06543 [Caballeronia choica]|uniref:Lipoprotein n=1 Tax=Caballeronia choica TaxID=326476 RepID=A0A158KN04_9BURK|nr:hypothetical protein [Caballeronia choica]SAL82502.1 hypothetical protein AWB68_06543 [Caballeronia choica]